MLAFNFRTGLMVHLSLITVNAIIICYYHLNTKFLNLIVFILLNNDIKIIFYFNIFWYVFCLLLFVQYIFAHFIPNALLAHGIYILNIVPFYHRFTYIIGGIIGNWPICKALKVKTGWLGIGIMCTSVATYLPAEYCSSETPL